MSGNLRKSFSYSSIGLLRIKNDNNTTTKRMGSFQKKLPTMIINSKSTKLLKLPLVEKKTSKKLFKQQSLTLSQLHNMPFNSQKLISTNFNLRKNSLKSVKMNIFRQRSINYSNTKLNNFNKIINIKNFNKINNYNSNNLIINNTNNKDTLDNSITSNRSTKKNINRIKSYQNILNKNQNINYNNRNQEKMLKIKNPYDFEVSEEDKMFNQYKVETPKKLKTKKEKSKIKLKLNMKKEKLKSIFSYHSPLDKVYKKFPQVLDEINKTKKLKFKMSLNRYQNLLLDVGSKNLPRETRDKLNDKFVSLRKSIDKAYVLFRDSLDKIEDEEKDIIDSINTQQDFYKKKMMENKYYTLAMSINLDDKTLPNLKLLKVRKPKYK